MRAAPGRAVSAPRLIARKSRQIGIASLVLTLEGRRTLRVWPPMVADYGEFRVKSYGTGAVLAEVGPPAQAERPAGCQAGTALFGRPPGAGAGWPVASVQ